MITAPLIEKNIENMMKASIDQARYVVALFFNGFIYEIAVR